VQEDQELACDHSVLSHCSEQDRYHYGKALMAGVGPQLVPSVLTFFSKGKERFTMLSKHKVSKLSTILGVSLCAVISVIALTKAPTSLANSQFLTSEAITLKFQTIPLRKTIEVVAGFNNIPVFNMDIVNENIMVFIHQENVPAEFVFKELLACGGLEFTEYESGIELRQVKHLGTMPENYCVITEKVHYLMEADEINMIDMDENMLGNNAKTTKFR